MSSAVVDRKVRRAEQHAAADRGRPFVAMVNAASTEDNANMRGFLDDHVFFVKDVVRDSHHLADLPEHVKALVRRDDAEPKDRRVLSHGRVIKHETGGPATSKKRRSPLTDACIYGRDWPDDPERSAIRSMRGLANSM
jgi:hypothetical protein